MNEKSDRMFSVQGRFAVVIGGTRGIGGAISRRLAESGATVLANYVRDEAAAVAMVEGAEKVGWSLGVVRADVTSPKGMAALDEAVGARSMPVSMLVFAAASGVHRPLEQLTLRHFDWTFGLNVRAFFEVVRHLLPRLANPSSVVAISSEGAVHAVQDYTLVGASKGAMESMVRHMAVELAPKGVRVNCLSPGTVETDAWKALPDAERRLSEAASRDPRGRLTTLEEVAFAAQFLCSDASGGMAGHTLVVDGGARIRE